VGKYQLLKKGTVMELVLDTANKNSGASEGPDILLLPAGSTSQATVQVILLFLVFSHTCNSHNKVPRRTSRPFTNLEHLAILTLVLNYKVELIMQ
jgi:hypothetical protein